MKRLRHPIRAIREPFGTAGLIVACVALVAALGGTAFAAAKLNSTQKKEVEKIAKKYAGKPGVPGANGAIGPAGTNGKDGAAGAPGTAGKSVVATAAGGECTTPNGTSYEIEGSGIKHPVCNGKNGTNGQPWTLGGTLPASTEPGCPCTETGAWGVAAVPPPLESLEFFGHGMVFASVSFPIPLAVALVEEHVHTVGPEEGEGEPNENLPAGCLGNVASPGAEEGFLCVFIAKEPVMNLFNPEPGIWGIVSLASNGSPGADTSGTTLRVIAEEDEAVVAHGTWAVTG